MSLLNNIKIILSHTSHPGNIGAAARAMATMGLTQLVLVNPKAFPHKEATARASGAYGLLDVKVVASLSEAIADCTWVVGSSSRARTLDWDVMDSRQCGERAIAAAQQGCVGIVFGNERAGLTNEELQQCHAHVSIPTSELYHSLNLAAAVQVVVYDVYMAQLQNQHFEPKVAKVATSEELDSFYQHLWDTLIDIEFIKIKNPKLALPRLKRLFNRASLEKSEVNLLRGVLTAAQKHVEKKS